MRTDEFITLVSTTGIMTATQFFIFMMLTEVRFNKRKTRLAGGIVAAVLLVVCVTGCVIKNSMREANWTLLTMTLPSLLFFLYISKYRGIKFIVTYCIADISIAGADMLAYMFVLLVFDGDFTIDTVCRCVVMAAWAAVLYLLIGDRYHRALDMLDKGWGLMTVVTVSMYTLISMVAAYPAPIRDRRTDLPVAMMTVAVMELMIVVIIRVIYRSLEIKERDVQAQVLTSQLAMAEQQFAMIIDNMEQIRVMKHDMKHHFNIIAILSEQRDYDPLRSYVQSYLEEEEKLFKESTLVSSRNYVINVLLGYYKDKAEKDGIKYTYEVLTGASIPVNDNHLVTILGNMWLNALEACREMPEAETRYINTRIVHRKQKLMIQCKNSFNGAVDPARDGKGLDSTKNHGRGMGLRSIERITEQYEGYCHYEYSHKEFVLQIILQTEEM